MIDILFVSHNRREFTQASLTALMQNTNWGKARLICYDDDSKDGTQEWVESVAGDAVLRFAKFGGPVDVMNHYLCGIDRDHVFAKIDSDTMVPPGWLDVCLDVLRRNPGLDFLGIEAFTPIDPNIELARSYLKARHIGGIGVFRTRAFRTLPRPQKVRYGFTEFQLALPELEIGWLDPSLPVFLLDHLPFEPWVSLSREYVERGWQRECGLYKPDMNKMWEWWEAVPA